MLRQMVFAMKKLNLKLRCSASFSSQFADMYIYVAYDRETSTFVLFSRIGIINS